VIVSIAEVPRRGGIKGWGRRRLHVLAGGYWLLLQKLSK